jgi:hypothetical protein
MRLSQSELGSPEKANGGESHAVRAAANTNSLSPPRPLFNSPPAQQAALSSRSPFKLPCHLSTSSPQPSPHRNMAKPPKRQASLDSKSKCPHSNRTAPLPRNSNLERRNHGKERRGPLIYCCVPGCKWSTRKMGMLLTHWDVKHWCAGS